MLRRSRHEGADEVLARLEELERRFETLDAGLRIAFEHHQRRLQKMARRAAGDARGEKKEPYLPYLIDLAGLRPDHTVLDIGCGQGNLTAELVGYLGPEGAYHGMDVRRNLVEKLVRWYARVDNFHFHHGDLRNSLYNPQGAVEPTEYRFPLDDGVADIVVLRSVFTHMLPAHIERYVAETARVLRPGAKSFVTYYLVNEESRPFLESRPGPEVPGSFPHDQGVYRVRFEDVPERAVALDERWVRDVHARHGLNIVEPIRYGSWCGREAHLSRQDIVLAEKLGAGQETASRLP